MKGVSRRTVLAGASIGLLSSRLSAQQPVEVKVGLLVPIFGLYARPGTVMREGAEMAVDHINAQGGVKSLGGAKLKLVVQGPPSRRRHDHRAMAVRRARHSLPAATGARRAILAQELTRELKRC